MSIRKFKRMGTKPNRTPSGRVQRAIDDAHSLIERKNWVEAQDLLTNLNRQAPNREEILVLLAQTHYHLHQFPAYLDLCIQVNQLLPSDAEHRLALAHAYLMNSRVALAHRTFKEFLDRWPGHEEAGRARETFDRIEEKIGAIFLQMELSGEDAYELAALNEEGQMAMEAARFKEGISVLENLLKRKPDFKPAYNNLSLMQYHLGEIPRAIENAEHVLRLDPLNFHALANLSRYLLVTGRPEEARRHAECLKRVECEYFDRWLTQAQACAELGDDQGVLEALAGARKTESIETGNNGFFLYHLAAAAERRLGHEKEARELWGECLRLSPAFSDARENLADLDAPPSEQNGPWSLNFRHWVAERAVEDLSQEIKKESRGSRKNMAAMVQQFLRKHPQILHVLPIFFDRGDPLGRDFAVDFAGWVKTPETIAMLREFGLGQKGSDEVRLKALQTLQRLRELESDRVRFWSRGAWKEIRLKRTEIYFEPVNDLPPEATALYIESYEALNRRDGLLAEELLRKALELVPDSPQLLNNLSSAYLIQGRREAAEAIALQIHANHPEYFFARTNLANRMIERGQYDEALAMIQPLEDLDRMHVSEAAGLYNTYIHLHFRKGEIEEARHWLETLEAVLPDDPQTEMWRAHLR